MPSSWKVWDFVKNRDQVIKSNTNLYLVHCYDQYAFKFVKEGFNESFNVVFGAEISQDWIDQKLRTLDLFGGMENYLIHFAEEIPKDISEQLCSLGQDVLGERKILLNFTKDNAFLKDQVESDNKTLLKIAAPAFWEEEELLNFLSSEFEVYLGFEQKRFFIENVPFEMGAYVDLLQKLKINFDGQNISTEDLESSLSVSKLDQFKLAELFGNKKMIPFYKTLIKLLEEGQDFYGPLYFLGSHMQKVYNQNYADSKKRLSKYDKQIIAQQRIWNQDQAYRAIKYFSDLLLLYKADKKGMLNRLRSDYIKVLYV